MATVGISTERMVVRGVLVAAAGRPDAPSTVLRTVERQVGEGDWAATIVEVLDDFVAESVPGTPIEDVAVTYRSAEERRAIVSGLAAGKWRSASLVSVKSALLAMAADMPGLDDFDTVLVVEALDQQTSLVVIGAGRQQILAADSWSAGISDADTTGKAVRRAWQLLDAIPVRPDAVVLCGSSADEPDIATVLHLGLAVPVLFAPDFTGAAARGAALLAADQLRDHCAEAPAGRNRSGVLVMTAATVVSLLGASAFAMTQLREERPPIVQIAGLSPAADQTATSAPIPSRNPDSVPGPDGAPARNPASAPGSSSDLVPGTASVPSSDPSPGAASVPGPAPAAPQRSEWPPAPSSEWVPPQTADRPPQPARPSANPSDPSNPANPPQQQPAPTTVGPPNGQWLFPGESPPPPPGSDPAVVNAWWDNHWQLKDRWLHGG